MNEKIAVLVDSGSNVNTDIQGNLDFVSLPLRIVIDQKEYIDGQDITLEEVFKALEVTQVNSSLPSGEDILNGFNQLKEAGYTHVIAIAISSGLSGTFNVIRNISEDIEGLTIQVIDTKNISLGSGFLAIKAAEMVREGKTFDHITSYIQTHLNSSKVFFTVGSLAYLIRGGRIGLVAGSVANVLNIKPVISCNDEGVYHTVTKVRGYGRVIKKMIDEAAKYVGSNTRYRAIILNADSKEDIDEVVGYAKSVLPYADDIVVTRISPALAIHTGPEALGIAILLED